MSSVPILRSDYAQEFLAPHLACTEALFREVLGTLDPAADCQIVPAADLCFPHDVIRLTGGFATGCVVDWLCRVPVIPVDTTVNVDTSSIFWLKDDVTESVIATDFDKLHHRIDEESSYEWNLHKGNHFISFARRRSDHRQALVIHSNEKEFKFKFNGLMPVEGNWFMDDVRTFRKGTRYLRLLVGDKAKLFVNIAEFLQSYNITRHRFLATVLLAGRTQIEDEYHKHHYFMPSAMSIVMGCYLCKQDETVPIFSKPGADIHFFKCGDGGSNGIKLMSGERWLLVPHGWGKTLSKPAQVTYDEKLLTINGQSFNVRVKLSLGGHPELIIRNFSEEPSAATSLYLQMAHHTPGVVVDSLQQVCSYTRTGFRHHLRLCDDE